MFALSDRQMLAMAEAQDEAYAKQLAAFMRELAPDLVAHLDTPSLDEAMLEAVCEGRKWNVSQSEGMVAVATLWIIADPEMFAEPKVIEYLEGTGATSTIDTRMIRLVEAIQADLLAESAGTP